MLNEREWRDLCRTTGFPVAFKNELLAGRGEFRAALESHGTPRPPLRTPPSDPALNSGVVHPAPASGELGSTEHVTAEAFVEGFLDHGLQVPLSHSAVRAQHEGDADERDHAYASLVHGHTTVLQILTDEDKKRIFTSEVTRWIQTLSASSAIVLSSEATQALPPPAASGTISPSPPEAAVCDEDDKGKGEGNQEAEDKDEDEDEDEGSDAGAKSNLWMLGAGASSFKDMPKK